MGNLETRREGALDNMNATSEVDSVNATPSAGRGAFTLPVH